MAFAESQLDSRQKRPPILRFQKSTLLSLTPTLASNHALSVHEIEVTAFNHGGSSEPSLLTLL